MSSVTPRERREVAKSLRYLADLPGGPLENDGQFVAVLKYWVFSGFKRYSYDETLTRLADLIDPTCHVTDEEVTHEPTLNALAVHVYRCDSCDWYFYMAEVCCHPKPFYCPMCGARVVRDEA